MTPARRDALAGLRAAIANLQFLLSEVERWPDDSRAEWRSLGNERERLGWLNREIARLTGHRDGCCHRGAS